MTPVINQISEAITGDNELWSRPLFGQLTHIDILISHNALTAQTSPNGTFKQYTQLRKVLVVRGKLFQK